MSRIYSDNTNRINKVVEFIKNNYSKNHDIQYYANICNMERKYFITVFKQCTGVSPQRYRTNLRIEEAKKLLLNTDMSSESIANAVGYSDPLYFSRVFKKYTGISPKFFREMGI
ncbi:MAG: helix-turn-helix transcriptional regulator [Bacillales bacterium]|nr:helix-turn-helix transcriptional regulator [Bacillales bacterium]